MIIPCSWEIDVVQEEVDDLLCHTTQQENPELEMLTMALEKLYRHEIELISTDEIKKEQTGGETMPLPTRSSSAIDIPKAGHWMEETSEFLPLPRVDTNLQPVQSEVGKKTGWEIGIVMLLIKNRCLQ